MRAELWGAEHVELGHVASASPQRGAAIALTRGRFLKSYGYLDANEDAVAVVCGPRATLLACADGHNGVTASHVALRHALDAFGDDPPPELSDREWLDLFEAINEAVLAATAGSEQPGSRTVLLLALAAAGRVSWGSMGDAAAVLAAPGASRGRQLNREEMRFVGYPMKRRALKSALQRGRVSLEADEWVVLVTDGLSEFVSPMRPADVVPRILATVPPGDAEAAALRLVDTACAAGAGDNVGVAILAPRSSRGA